MSIVDSFLEGMKARQQIRNLRLNNQLKDLKISEAQEAPKRAELENLRRNAFESPEGIKELAITDPGQAKLVAGIQEDIKLKGLKRVEAENKLVAQTVQGAGDLPTFVSGVQRLRQQGVIDDEDLQSLFQGLDENNLQDRIQQVVASAQTVDSFLKRQDPQSTFGKLQADRSRATGAERKELDRQIQLKNTPKSGVSVTTPDGTLVQVGGSIKQGLSKSNVNKTQAKIISAEESRQKIKSIMRSFDPRHLTFAGKIRNFWAAVKEKAGIDLDPDEVKNLRMNTKFRQAVEQMFNIYRKEITGAAAAVQELDRLKKSFINTDLSPTEFKAAVESFLDEINRGLRLKRRFLREGIDIGTKAGQEKIADAILTGADDDIEIRGAELRAAGKTDDEIADMLIDEGYLSGRI